MEKNGVQDEVVIVMEVRDEGDNLLERIFEVGELVEFWEGAFVRGYRADSGEAAFVKRVEGGGNYAIKMVGSGRGKYRQVNWRQIYKDGSFNKNLAEVKGKRVRSSERMREIEQDKAEAKFERELRQTRQELGEAENQIRVRDKEADNRIKKQEVVARQAEKDKRNELKRSLDKMEQDMTADMQTMKEEADIEVRTMRQVIRELRQDVKEVEEEREGLRELLIEVEERQGNVKTKQDKVMKTLNERNLRLEQKQKERDECIVVLEGVVKQKTKDIVGLGKGIVVLEKQIGSLKKRLEAEMTERTDCVKKLDECIEGQQRTIVTLETKIVGHGRNIVALGEKNFVLERRGEEHTKRHGDLLHKLDAAEKQHEADEKFQRKQEGKSNKDRTKRIAAEAAAFAAEREAAKAIRIGKELRDDLENARIKLAEFDELRSEDKKEESRAILEMTAPGKGRPKSLAFEHQVRTILASGCSARAAVSNVLGSARVYLTAAAFEQYEKSVPNLRWFQQQREALGNEAWLYSMIELCRAEKVLQWGFDETTIDGTPTLNQWVLVPNGDFAPRVITIQYAGILVGSKAIEICHHVEQAWATGQRAIELLRVELGDEADNMVPLEGGGVGLHKIRAVMHDTCATANLTATLMKEKRNTSGQLRFGYDEWEALADEQKPWFDFLCGNHVRNLPIDEFNRLFEEFIRTYLGAELDTIRVEGNGRTRVEASGVLLLRSLCRLTHTGHLQYAKGDGQRFADWLQTKYEGAIINRCAGRAEYSKRQDWCCEASWKFLNLVQPINLYTIETLILDPNILRDSVLTRIEQIRFQAYIHVNAIMWKVCFQELRALTNTKQMDTLGLGVNPMELSDIYEHVWNLGLLLQTEDCLSVLECEYRPWPKVREEEACSAHFYAVLDRSREEDLAELRLYAGREDIDNYEPVLREVLHLFGAAIITSLERTMGNYLKSTGGVYRNELREEWELEEVSKLLSHNNAAERPFAVVKAYLDVFPTMKLSTLANYSLAMTNGSHRPAGTLGKTKKTKNRERLPPGIAVTSPPRLKLAVTKVCGVRRVHTGIVTQLMRDKNAQLIHEGDEHRKAKHKADLEQKARLQFKKGVQHNKNMTEVLAMTKDAVEAHLTTLGNSVGTSLAYLKRQFDARKARADGDKFFYPGIAPAYKKTNGRDLKKTPSHGEDKVQYLKDLLLQMMLADSRRNASQEQDQPLSGLVRSNPVISLVSTDPLSTRAKKQQDINVGLSVSQADDPWLVQLEAEYVGKLCFLNDISLRHKLYRICKISFWDSSRSRNASWEATMEPVHVYKDDTFFVHDDDAVIMTCGKRLVKARSLLGYILAEYVDGDDADPTRTDCVDKYIMDALAKHHAYTAKSNRVQSRALSASSLPATTIS